jgi:branched-chain amino acid transport system substrate-binding protein
MRKTRFIVIGALLLLATAGVALAQGDYDIGSSVVSTGGGERASENYMVRDVAGESAIGISQSDNYLLLAGFPPPAAEPSPGDADQIGLYSPTYLAWVLDDGDGSWNPGVDDTVLYFGIPDAVPVVGDWDGDGVDQIGICSTTHLAWALDDGDGTWEPFVDDTVLYFGVPGAVPVAGDWDGDGADQIGIYLPSPQVWVLDNGDGSWNPGVDDTVLHFGIPGAVPVAGDWDGDGVDQIGIYIPSMQVWVLDNGDGSWNPPGDDTVLHFGIPGAVPVVGDHGYGIDWIGTYIPSMQVWVLDNGDGTWHPGVDDYVLHFGIPGAVPVVGVWEMMSYKVGAVFSITGPASNIGIPEENTVDMMVDQINDAGGINGHPLEVIIYDDESDAEQCVTMVTRLIEQDEVLAIIGPSTSGNSLHILDTVTTAEIPLVSLAASSSIVVPVEERYWIFKTPQTDKEAVAEIYTYLQSVDISNIALITATDWFGAAGRDVLIDDAPDYGLTIVDDQTFDSGDPSMLAQLTHIGGTDAEAVICWSLDIGSATVARDIQTLLLEIPLYCSHAIATRDFIDEVGDAANGVIFPAGKLLIVDQLPPDDPQKEVLVQYRDNYEALYGEGTVSTFGGHAYDALSMVVMALEEMDEGLDLANARAAVRDGIEGIENFAGISGIFTMSPTDHLGMQPGSLAMIEIVDGEWTLK